MRLGARAVATPSVVGRHTGGPRTLPVIPVDVGRNHDHGVSTARQACQLKSSLRASRVRRLGRVDERPGVLGR